REGGTAGPGDHHRTSPDPGRLRRRLRRRRRRRHRHPPPRPPPPARRKPTPEPLALIARSRGDDYAYEEQNQFGTTIAARTRGGNATGWDGYRIGRNRQGEKMDVVAELRAPTRLPAAGERYDTLVITER